MNYQMLHGSFMEISISPNTEDKEGVLPTRIPYGEKRLGSPSKTNMHCMTPTKIGVMTPQRSRSFGIISLKGRK